MRKAFTLIELIVALTIIALIVAASFPSLRAFHEDAEARKPVTEFVQLVQETRRQAMSDREPRQIVFDQGVIYSLRYSHPYDEGMTFKEFLLRRKEENQRILDEIARMEVLRVQVLADEPPAADGSTTKGEDPKDKPPEKPAQLLHDEVREQALPEGMTCEVKGWGEPEWQVFDGRYFRRWVFQSNGLCDPLSVRFLIGKLVYELEFDPLTGELRKQRSYEGK